MKSSAQRLIEYYKSDMFLADFQRLEAEETAGVTAARLSMTSHLRFNLDILGIASTPEERKLTAQFEAGLIPWHEMLVRVKTYIESVARSSD